MSEYNICGVVIHARNEKIESVEKLLTSAEGVEVHASSDAGRLVVTVESEDKYYVADMIDSFKDIDGVLTASMIYQFCDQANQAGSNSSNEGVSA